MEVCEMQSAENLLSIISDRGRKNLELERLYRILYNKELYLIAYSNIYANEGAMTAGVTDETVDGMSVAKIEKIIENIKLEKFVWHPVRREYIKKKNGKLRPLGLPTWTDKLLQEVIRIILEAYYEAQFSETSHGFRPNKGVHTALQNIRYTWKSVKWFIEGDISDCFGTIDHEILLSILARKIKDNRFLRLIKHFLECGYMEDWKYNKTLSGSPQGGVLSPLLSNIYMNELDKYAEEEIIPQYTMGTRRAESKEYKQINFQVKKSLKNKNIPEYKRLLKLMRNMPSKDTYDPKFKRIYYMRYADDWLIGVSGNKKDSEEIKERIKTFLANNLKLNLSVEKTLITNAKEDTAKFLGYEVLVLNENTKLDHRGQRNINGSIGFKVPDKVIKEKIDKYTRSGKPMHRKELTVYSDYDIVAQYQSELRGLVQFYTMAYNVHKLSKLKWIMEISLTKTLANKFKTSVPEIYKRYKATIETKDGKYKVVQIKVEREGKKPLIAHFGGIKIASNKNIPIKDTPSNIFNTRSQLIDRLLRNECELCGSQTDIEIHHLRKLKDTVKKYGTKRPLWLQRMVAMNRKTLAVCLKCHHEITYGRYDGEKLNKINN